MVQLAIALTLFAPRSQGDIFDGDPIFHSIEYQNVDIGEALRHIFRHVYANYSIESGIQGNVNLHLVNTPFSKVLSKTLDQVQSSANFERGLYIVEKMPAHPSSFDILERKLPAYNFQKITLKQAFDNVFSDAKTTYRLSKMESKIVSLKIPIGTLKQGLQVLLPLARCKANYTHGHFELLPDSVEKPSKETLEKRVHGIDFIDIEAKDAFKAFFKQIGAEYILGPNIDNRFTLLLRDAKFEDALDTVCQLTDTTYQLQSNVYKIERRSFQ